MNERFSVFIQREKAELAGTLWLNNARGKLSSAFAYDKVWLQNNNKFALDPDLPLDQYPKACEAIWRLETLSCL